MKNCIKKYVVTVVLDIIGKMAFVITLTILAFKFLTVWPRKIGARLQTLNT